MHTFGIDLVEAGEKNFKISVIWSGWGNKTSFRGKNGKKILAIKNVQNRFCNKMLPSLMHRRPPPSPKWNFSESDNCKDTSPLFLDNMFLNGNMHMSISKVGFWRTNGETWKDDVGKKMETKVRKPRANKKYNGMKINVAWTIVSLTLNGKNLRTSMFDRVTVARKIEQESPNLRLCPCGFTSCMDAPNSGVSPTKLGPNFRGGSLNPLVFVLLLKGRCAIGTVRNVLPPAEPSICQCRLPFIRVGRDRKGHK